MKSVTIRTTKQDRKPPASQQQQQSQKPVTQGVHVLPLSPCDDLPSLIAKRAYELYSERGYRDGSAVDNWLEAEREILSQIPSV